MHFMMLGCSKPLFGYELVLNGGFDSGDNWNPVSPWTIGSGVATKTGGTAAVCQQTIPIEEGATYRCTYDITTYNAGVFDIRFQGGTTTIGTSRASTGTFQEDLVAQTGNTAVAIRGNAAADGAIDNVSVVKLSSGVGGGGGSPPAFVQAAQSANNSSSSTISASLTGVTAGNAIAVGVAWYGSGGVSLSSVTDGSNTYNAIGTAQSGTVDISDLVHAQYAMNVSGGNLTVTANFSGACTYRRIVVFELSGVATTSALDVNNQGNQDSATPSLTATGAATNTLGIGLVWNEGTATNTYTPGSGWTEPTNGEAYDDYAFQMQYMAHAGGGDITSSWTKANTGNNIMKVFTLKAP